MIASAAVTDRGYHKPLLLPADAKAGEAAVEARQAAAAIEQLGRAPGPGRVGVRIDVEIERRALFAIGRTGHELDAVRHDDLDHVIVGVDIGFHRTSRAKTTKSRPEVRRLFGWLFYRAPRRPMQAAAGDGLDFGSKLIR